MEAAGIEAANAHPPCAAVPGQNCRKTQADPTLEHPARPAAPQSKGSSGAVQRASTMRIACTGSAHAPDAAFASIIEAIIAAPGWVAVPVARHADVLERIKSILQGALVV